MTLRAKQKQPNPDTVTITLQRNDIGQIVDGLRERADQYARTAEYHESDGAGDACDYGDILEVTDANEARQIEAHYRDIINQLERAL